MARGAADVHKLGQLVDDAPRLPDAVQPATTDRASSARVAAGAGSVGLAGATMPSAKRPSIGGQQQQQLLLEECVDLSNSPTSSSPPRPSLLVPPAYAAAHDGDASPVVTAAVEAQKPRTLYEWDESDRFLKQTTPFKAKVAARESDWQRPFLTEAMRSPSIKSGESSVYTRPPFVQRRDPLSNNRTLRPNIHQYVLQGRRAYVIDCDSNEGKRLLSEYGQNSVPCGNEECHGLNGQWCTNVLSPSWISSAPRIAIEGKFDVAPLVSNRSKCSHCQCIYHHFNATTMSRMPPQFTADLNFETDWIRGDIIFSRDVTTPFDYDMINRQGAANLVAKGMSSGCELFERQAAEYYSVCQLWRTQLEETVANKIWSALPEDRQLSLVRERAELVLVRDAPNAVTHFGKATDQARRL